MAEKARCPHCGKPLTALYRQRRGPPKKPGELGKLENLKAPWIECEGCEKIYRPGAIEVQPE